MNEIIENFKKVLFANYANFEGRARRSEYWLFTLVLHILLSILMIPFIFILLFAIGDMVRTSSAGTFIVVYFVILAVIGLIGLAVFLPVLALTVRRLHDANRSGWWILLSFLPLGNIAVLYFLILDGDDGANEYGEDPKEEERNYYYSLV